MGQVTNVHIAKNKGAVMVTEKAQITGANVALRDVHIYDSKPMFSVINPALYEQDSFLAPTFMFEVLQKSINHRAVIIGEGYDFDKSEFALHLSLLIQKQFPSLQIIDTLQNVDSSGLLKELRKTAKPSVFLLNELHPNSIDYAFEKLLRIAKDRNHFVIITSDAERDVWGLSEELLSNYWIAIPEIIEYDKAEILGFLHARLLKHKNNFPYYDLEVEDFQSTFSFAANASYKWVGNQLNSPVEVEFFVDQLCALTKAPEKEQIQKIVDSTTDKNSSLIIKWFRKKSRKEQLIILSALLLEGLYDGQYFSVLRDIVKGFWEYSSPSIQSLDYYDLEFLSGFFRFEKKGAHRTLQIKSNKQRKELIIAVWKTHQRHIIMAFPGLLTQIKNTLRSDERDWEKYGTSERRGLLREVVGNTISDIGLVCFSSVESVFLEMAAQHEISLQIITAKALARWRSSNEDDKLFEVLESWLTGDRVERLVRDLLKRKELSVTERELSGNAAEYIKSSIVMTISYASKYDQPNKLHPKIVALLKEMVTCPYERVQKNLIRALPKIIHHHSLQLRNDLLDFMAHDFLAEAIGKGLAKAYSTYPKDIKSTLDFLLNQCVLEHSKENHRLKAAKRDNVLITVLTALQHIDFEEVEGGSITSKYIFDILEKFQKHEKRRIVRNHLVVLGAKVGQVDFDKAFFRMETFFGWLSKDERLLVVDQWVEHYVHQRAKLLGNEYTIELGEKTFPAWDKLEERPLTSIERVLFQWMEGKSKIAKEYATLCFIGFAKSFEEFERNAVQTILEQRKQSNPIIDTSTPKRIYRNQIQAKSKANAPEKGLPFWPRIYIFFIFLFEKRARKDSFRTIVRVLLNSNHYSKTQLALVFEKWFIKGNMETSRFSIWLSPMFK